MLAKRVSPVTVRRVALIAVVAYAVLLVSGATVRLSGSGLGCSSWPECSTRHLTGTLSDVHSMVEFCNRVVSGLVVVISGLALVVALLRSPKRRDLCWLGGGLVAGVVFDAVLGGLVVIFKLNPYLVAVHFILTIPVLACAIVMYHRASVPDDHDWTRSSPLIPTELRWLSYLLLGAMTIVTCIGPIVAGAGPHAGSATANGKPIPRIPILFRAIAQLHADAALFLIGIGLASLLAFHRSNVPPAALKSLRTLFELMICQGTLGYLQYFLHDNAFIITFHVAGVSALWTLTLFFFMGLHEHPQRGQPPADQVQPAVSAVAAL